MKTKLLLLIWLFSSIFTSCGNDTPMNNDSISLENVVGLYFNARFDFVCGNQEQYWNNYDKETKMFATINKIIMNFSKEKRMKFYIMTFSFDSFLDTESLGKWGNIVVCNGDLEALKL